MPQEITAEGKKKLEERLSYLKNVARREVAERIKEAREFGDISENAEYDAAKEEQAMIEGEIFEIETKLRTAIVIEDGKHDIDTVGVGSTVKILDMDMNETFTYKIVGTVESDPDQNKLSKESPVGKALLGHKKNDIVEVTVPSGKIKFKILKIS
ncbi:MAG TPA: transcription elongation factor GreA [Clostridiales bacterium]|jgi:transcription elongation factor GreA|nr:transcription elongation factor GreA [Clostridiales bacterium]